MDKFILHKTVRPSHWIETKYGGRTYLVEVRSLLDAYIMRKEKEHEAK